MPEIFIRTSLYEELIRVCVNALPHKAFGLIGGTDLYHPTTLYPCKTNLRNDPEWKSLFESFGEFYKDPDLGFVISHPEVKTVLDAIDSKGESFVGIFHSHRYLKAEPSEIDEYLSSGSDQLSYIVSVVDPSAPVIGVFRLNGGGFRNIPILKY